jgi:lipoprotein
MKKIIYIIALLIFTSCAKPIKEGGVEPITTESHDKLVDKSKVSINENKTKSPNLNRPSFKPIELNYEIIKPEFLIEERFDDLETQNKYAVMMVEYFDKENKTFYVSKIINDALNDPKVKLSDDFDDKMNFATDLFLLSPFYSRGDTEAYIYYNYFFNEETFKLIPRLKIEENTKTYLTANEQGLVKKQIDVLVKYANENYNNQYDKAYYFAQWLAENNEYQFESSKEDIIENNMYGALIKGKSQCSGFAQSFAVLCQRVGIPAYSLTGNTKAKSRPEEYSGEHQRNVIKLNGSWSYVDITGMVTNGSQYYYYYFDRSKSEFVDYYVSKFFNDIEQYIR